jgi:TPR repeat protein
VKFYQDKAEKGDAYGQYRMGMYYLKGESVPTDLDKARDYFSKAAAQGNQEAATELAKLSAPEPPVRTNSPPKKGEDR